MTSGTSPLRQGLRSLIVSGPTPGEAVVSGASLAPLPCRTIVRLMVCDPEGGRALDAHLTFASEEPAPPWWVYEIVARGSQPGSWPAGPDVSDSSNGASMRVSPVVVLICLALSACGGKAPPSPTQPQELLVATLLGGGAVLQSGLDALREFSAQVEPQYEHGECMVVRNEPEPGVRTLVVHFPDRKAPHTGVAVTLDADGKLVRYIENRGIPKPNKDPAAIQEEMRRMPRTIVNLDYVTGQAIAHNTGGEKRPSGVRASVKEFERAGVVRDIPVHVSVVEALCADRGESDAPVMPQRSGSHGGRTTLLRRAGSLPYPVKQGTARFDS